MAASDTIRLLLLVASAAVSYVLLYLNRALPPYGDEADNLLGGRLIAQGYRLYADYFSNHAPLPYYLAAVATRLGISDLVPYRVFFSLFFLLFLLTASVRLWRAFPLPFLPILFLTLGLGFGMFSGEMFLADHLFALALGVTVLLFLSLAPGERLSTVDQLIVSLCVFLAVQSTLIGVYPFVIVAGYYAAARLVRWRRTGRSLDWAAEGRFAAILLAPHLALLGALAMDGVLGDWFYQTVQFNQIYYARYELASDPLGILQHTLPAWLEDVETYLRPSSFREIETFFLVNNLLALGLLWWKRGAGLAAMYLGVVILSRIRGNSGYHGSPYFVLTCISVALVLTFSLSYLWERFSEWRRARPGVRPRQMGLAAAGLLMLAYAALFYHDVGGFYLHMPRGQGMDDPYADAVVAMTAPSDRVWMAPFEPYSYFKANRAPASAYSFFFPWQGDSLEITAAVLNDLQRVQPPVIVFRADKEMPWYFPLPTLRQYAPTILAYIQSGYVPANASDAVLRDVYLRNDIAPLLRARLSHGAAPDSGT